MPRTKPLGSDEMKAQVRAYHAAQVRAKDDDPRIRRELNILKARIGVTHKQLAKMLGMTVDTWKYRRENPSSFKLGEIRAVQELAKIYNTEVAI